MVKVLSQNSNGLRVVADAFFANFKTAQILGAEYRPVDLRSLDKKIVYKDHRKLALETVEVVHLLKTIADLPNRSLSSDSKTITLAADAVIDGVAVEDKDKVQISKTLAASMSVSGGTWQFSGKKELTLLNPPVYTISNVYNSIGYPWRYRKDEVNGDLIGLASVVPTGQVITQSAVKILQMVNLLNGNHNSFCDASSLNSGQSASIAFDSIVVRRIALRATSAKVKGDVSFPSSTFGFRNQSGPIGNILKNIRTGVWAWNGSHTYARGQREDWVSDTTERTLSGFQINDAGGSRSWISIELACDQPCRLWIDGEYPSPGSTVVIPEYVSSTFFESIEAGSYTVISNSGNEQWRLRKA